MITIRQAHLDDAPQLIELLRALFSIEKEFSFNEEKQRLGLQMLIGNVHCCVLAAEYEGHIVGMCTGQITVSTAEGGPALLVEDVVVKNGYRSQGIGKRLMAEISIWAKQMRATRLQLLADEKNSEALGFYKSLGWQITQMICLRKYI